MKIVRLFIELLKLLTSSCRVCQLNELKQSHQKSLADKEEETTAKLVDLDVAHKGQLSGDLIAVVSYYFINYILSSVLRLLWALTVAYHYYYCFLNSVVLG